MALITAIYPQYQSLPTRSADFISTPLSPPLSLQNPPYLSAVPSTVSLAYSLFPLSSYTTEWKLLFWQILVFSVQLWQSRLDCSIVLTDECGGVPC